MIIGQGLVLMAGVAGICFAQQEFEITIPTTLGDTTETFWLQIPAGYQPGNPCPLLIGWHTLYADHREFRNSTDFDSIANARGWIAASHDGPIPPGQTAPCHWNNHAAQSHVVDMIHCIEARFSVDSSRIYTVGASMGGAAGMVFFDNHLDPQGPMVAAAASVSGIQDCERRFYEQGINYSMISAFGGSPSRVPFTYHRNSAIYFADSTQSMHFNVMHLPLWLTFGNAWTDSIWRLHAEDLYAVLEPFADTVVLRESANEGHGWPAAESNLICDFFENFTLNRYPLDISINADEEGRWYWAEIAMRDSIEHFARFEGQLDTIAARINFVMLSNVASAKLDLLPTGLALNETDAVTCDWSILDGLPAALIFSGVTRNPMAVFKNGASYSAWSYNPGTLELALQGEGSGEYDIIFDFAVPPVQPPPYRGPVLTAWRGIGEDLIFQISESGTLTWELFNLLGRQVLSESSGWQQAGIGVISMPEGLPSGIYFLRLELAGAMKAQIGKRVVVLK